MPLSRNLWVSNLQRAVRCDNITGAHWTAAAARPRRDSGVPLMGNIFTAQPPEFFAAAWSNLMWSNGRIFCGVPLRGDLRVQCLERSRRRSNLTRTYRAAIASCTITNG